MKQTLLERIVVCAVVVATATSVFAQTRFVVRADPTLAKQIGDAVRAADDEGNHAAALRERRRWLELYPNEPIVQAAIYQTMSATAEESGDARAASEFAAIAKAIDPTLTSRTQANQPATTTTRGDKTRKLMAAMTVMMATLSAVQEVRQQNRQQQMPQQPIAQQEMQQPYGYPAAPAGAPGYQPPQGPAQPMPGYAPQGYTGQSTGYAPPPGYYAATDPNVAPANYREGAVVRRGDAAKPMRVVHDHSLANDESYFSKGCGALLSVDGTTVIFTPGGGEAPRVIQATDIREMRVNTAVGKDVGAFHIATKQGLYLHLAPESGSADDARAIIAALTKALGL